MNVKSVTRVFDFVFGYRDERERVRVKFFQQSKPQEVDLPDEPLVFGDCDFVMASAATVAISDSNHVTYNRQER